MAYDFPITNTVEIPRPCWKVALAEADVDLALARERMLGHYDRFAYSQKSPIIKSYGSAGVENLPIYHPKRWAAAIFNGWVRHDDEPPLPTSVYASDNRVEREIDVIAKLQSGEIRRAIVDVQIDVFDSRECIPSERKKICPDSALVGSIKGYFARNQTPNNPEVCEATYYVSDIPLAPKWLTSRWRDDIKAKMYNTAESACERIFDAMRGNPNEIDLAVNRAASTTPVYIIERTDE